MAKIFKVACHGLDKAGNPALAKPVNAIVEIRNGELNSIKCPLRMRFFAKSGKCWFIGCNPKNEKTSDTYDNSLGLAKCAYF